MRSSAAKATAASAILVIFALGGFLGALNWSSADNESVEIDLLARDLLDGRNAAVILSKDDLLTRVTIPISALDLKTDRRGLLTALFDQITSGQNTDQARVEAWVRYVQDRIAHPKWAPLLDNGQAIYDPYWILKNRLGQCGQTNRVVVDGLLAAGFRARGVQLKAHVAAEVWFDGQWHYLDADWLNLGQFVKRKDGTLPSAMKIFLNPSLLNGLRPGTEFKMYAADVSHPEIESYAAMFDVSPYYYVKTATRGQERNEYYGWNHYKTVRE